MANTTAPKHFKHETKLKQANMKETSKTLMSLT